MRRGTGPLWILLIFFLGCAAEPLAAHETDQFTTPIGREFVDLGPFFSQWAYDLLDAGVKKTNEQILAAIERGGDVATMQRPEQLVDNIHSSLPWSVHEIEAFEWLFLSDAMRERYPGRLVSYRETNHNIYENAFAPFDYRVFSRWFFASTIKVYGTYMGTDKLGHFTDEGIAYYWAWRLAKKRGESESQAVAAAVRIGTQGPGSEAGWLGLAANGDYANGDLAANYLGFLFYRNVAEETLIAGVMRPPMVVRDGPLWKLADHVRRDSDFFALFITDHLDEALNPGFFDLSMRPALRAAVRERTPAILWRYRTPDGSPRPREYFQQKLEELSTFWGIDYGHRGRPAELVSIANSCFQGTADPTDDDSHHSASGVAARENDEGAPLLVAYKLPAKLKRTGALSPGLASASPAAHPDEFGRTPLHDAALAGKIDAAAKLLAGGANPNAADAYQTTPLHLACRSAHLEMVRELVESGASVNATNAAGSTPLHEAALGGNPQIVQFLLLHGADRLARDRRQMTAADVAAARHNDRIASLLR